VTDYQINYTPATKILVAASKISGTLKKYGNNTRLIMNENHDLGDAVAALAALSGATKVQAAIQAANFLAALTGPRGGLVCLGEEVQPIGASMISVGGDSPEQARMTELLFSPLRFLQEDLIDYSQRVEPKLRDRLAILLADPHHKDYGQRRVVLEAYLDEAEQRHATRQAGKSTQMVSSCHPVDRYEEHLRNYGRTQEQRESAAFIAAECAFAKVDYETMLEYNEARCLREPLVLLENPDSQLLLRGMDQVHRQSPLVLDSDGCLLAGIFGKPRHKAAEVIEGLLTGRSTRAVRRGGGTPGRGILFSITDHHRLTRWMNHHKGSHHLSRALLVDPTRREEDEENPCDVEVIREGYARYRKTVESVLRLRRLNAPGIYPILEAETAERFFHGQRKFQVQIDEVEPFLKLHAATFVHLPATMLWSLEQLCHARKFQELIPTAFHLAEVAMKTHLQLVNNCLAAGARQSIEEEGLRMLRKLLQSEPCRFRELYRRYPDQNVSLHRPTFEYLIETERVREVGKGLYQVSELGRIELESAGVN